MKGQLLVKNVSPFLQSILKKGLLETKKIVVANLIEQFTFDQLSPLIEKSDQQIWFQRLHCSFPLTLPVFPSKFTISSLIYTISERECSENARFHFMKIAGSWTFAKYFSSPTTMRRLVVVENVNYNTKYSGIDFRNCQN